MLATDVSKAAGLAEDKQLRAEEVDRHAGN
jgi:hypothetical protein